ncbi:nuclear protein SNF4 [Cryptococcus gattii E566]|uniref:Nuclear protein SNF4 n=2 Tax=Cryptococcus gattii TaxID=37769 RepID=A0ABR5BN56_9TREE|nr:Snf1p protein kinase activator, putative; Snf4p [Cryptococcus gattii WM276]ADV20385.1 Snf1p protein kinase activator, putative; Snf4p [Cryptococcus gattii WM276]KIR77087.1 nuclear protein SNF4 [Cryptococcus gattii EJB2]KIY36130.1 nuclear protein SNF4 [Cryptococcus gattii E566]KJE00358.1 nuclear protein SNF4 [Cryptococcus gattii NT-10]
MSSTSPTASFRPNQRSSQTYHPQISTSITSSTASQPFSDRAPVSIARRPSRAAHPPMAPPRPLTHDEALEALRAFLKERSSYDVFPVSFRLIVLDTQLKVKKALDVMLLYGVVSAPLWNTSSAQFAGMFTVQDVIHLIQYYYHTSSWEGATADVEQFRLQSIRDIEKVLHVPPPPLLYVHPLRPLYDACRYLIRTHARRLPLIDKDPQTNGEVVISVLTQYRVLKFIAMNCRDITQYLTASVQELGIGTYVSPNPDPSNTNKFWPIAAATMKTTVFDVVHMFSEQGISAVPIVDDQGKVLNLYETVDVITLVRNGAYTSLDLTIAQALKQRAVDFAGVVTCSPKDSLSAIFSLIKIRRVHRLVVVAGQDDGQPGRLVGVISLSDIMRALIGNDIPLGGAGVGAMVVDRALREEGEEGAFARSEGSRSAGTSTEGQSTE